MSLVKKLLSFLTILLALLFSQNVRADDEVDYSITSYEGTLQIHEDNSATFKQVVSYHYDSSFNGQYVTLGIAGDVPDNFDISKPPLVQAETNGQQVTDTNTQLEDLGDGYRLKIYNGGYSGDTVVISVVWDLVNMTYPYQDVAELNWKPISDWDETIDKVTFTVQTDKTAKKSNLWGHRGYFKESPQKYWDGNGSYTLEAHDVDGVFELHGYWDASILNASVVRLPEKALPRIKKTEVAIEQKSKILLVIFSAIVPVGLVILLIIQVWRFIGVKKVLDHFRPKLGATRLYEVPEDLSPLALTYDLYQVAFKDLTENPKGNKIHFDNAVQAVILDLLDRGALTVNKEGSIPSLSIVNLDVCTSSDVAFLDMAFGNHLTLALDKLFGDFQYDNDITKRLRKEYSGSQLEKEVRKSSQGIRSRITAKVSAIDKAVKKELKQLKFPKIYRKMTNQESRKLQSASGFGCLALLVTGGLTFYFIIKGHLLALLYLLMTLGILVMTLILTRLSKPYVTLGVLTEEGSPRLEKWQSFERMIRDINTFEVVELEGIVVWNRLLVYATLFGYANKVENYLKVNHISLPEQFENIDTRFLRHQMILSTNHFVSTSSNVTAASNFSVSSGGSSGGGGFSGGGGGGGGGSF